MGLFCREWLAFRHNLCGSHLQSQSELYSLTSSRFYSLSCWEEKTTRSNSDEFQANQVRWWCWTLVINLIGQLSRDVIGRLSVMSLARFDLSIVRVEPVVRCHKKIVWLNTNERQKMVMSTITLLNTIFTDETSNRLGTVRHVLRILQTTINDLLYKAGLLHVT